MVTVGGDTGTTSSQGKSVPNEIEGIAEEKRVSAYSRERSTQTCRPSTQPFGVGWLDQKQNHFKLFLPIKLLQIQIKSKSPDGVYSCVLNG